MSFTDTQMERNSVLKWIIQIASPIMNTVNLDNLIYTWRLMRFLTLSWCHNWLRLWRTLWWGECILYVRWTWVLGGYSAACYRQNNGSPKDIPMSIPWTTEYVILHGKRDFADVIIFPPLLRYNWQIKILYI